MYYYEVWVSSQRYHSEKPLNYSYDTKLGIGMVVTVPLQRQTVAGIIVNQVKQPAFSTKNILRMVSDEPLPIQLLELITWLRTYYPAPFGQIVSTVIPSILTTKSRQSSATRKPGKPTIKLPPLSKEQALVLEQIRASKQRSILLHGDTGTGKTRVYLELAKENLGKGRSVILLTPEIGLTPQLAITCQEIFPNQTVVIHSELGAAARRNIWLRILQTKQPLVIIGPRSALFTPIKNLGLVVVDEFHETSYKQEQAPHYHATRVGARLAQLHGAQLVMGSATPTVSDYYVFSTKKLPIVRMQQQAVEHRFGDPTIKVVDLKDKQRFSRSAWLSDALIHAIKQAIKDKQQSLVFLNRRGTARLVLCQVCGWQAFCPNCDLPLTYHGDTHIMQCHTCGYSGKTPSICPECSADDIVFRSIGTKSIVLEIERLIPGARIARFDSDTNKSDSLEQQYTSVKEGSVDILVGTQMLGKGLDLPRLAVVGIVTAETSLSFPDYTSEERTFQLITQALGRVNRGHLLGTAVVQTHHPDSPLLKAAISKNYEIFYGQQINERQLYKFPPFRHALKLACARANSASARQASTQLASKLRKIGKPIEIIGPNPAFAEKARGKYHWQLVIKAIDRQILIDIIKDLPANWSYDIDPMNLL